MLGAHRTLLFPVEKRGSPQPRLIRTVQPSTSPSPAPHPQTRLQAALSHREGTGAHHHFYQLREKTFSSLVSPPKLPAQCPVPFSSGVPVYPAGLKQDGLQRQATWQGLLIPPPPPTPPPPTPGHRGWEPSWLLL